jgi:3-dehydroquinate dehydratase-2
VINGPGLNLLGTRQPEIYGHGSLGDIEAMCEVTCTAQNAKLIFRQSNHEGELGCDLLALQGSSATFALNPGACCLRFDIFDLLLVEDQQTANRSLCQCPNFGG